MSKLTENEQLVARRPLGSTTLVTHDLVSRPESVTPVLPGVRGVQVAAGADHIYAFEFGPDWLLDSGVSPADLNNPANRIDSFAPVVTGTDGLGESPDQLSNKLDTGPPFTVNVARTADIYYECILDKVIFANNNNKAYAHVGIVAATGHSVLARFNAD